MYCTIHVGSRLLVVMSLCVSLVHEVKCENISILFRVISSYCVGGQDGSEEAMPLISSFCSLLMIATDLPIEAVSLLVYLFEK